MLVELAINSAVAELTGMSPVHVTYGYRLQMPADHLDGMHIVQAVQD